MAQTLKFGNKVWAAKEESVLAYNDINNNYKPLPFTFSRASTGTRVNKDGLIETMGQDIARIDYTDSADGVLLLEPVSTNIIPYSEDFSQSDWVKTNCTISANQSISPDGTLNADLMTATADDARIEDVVGSTGTVVTQSIYVKSANGNDVSGQIDFAGANVVTFTANNEWQRVETTLTNTSINPRLRVRITNNGDSIYVWGGQVEALSYSTSYIPTSGSSVTRAAETCNKSGNSEVFNDSEGVLFADISSLGDSQIYKLISISDGTNNNRVTLGYNNSAVNKFYFQLKANSSSLWQELIVKDINVSKIAFKYKSGQQSVFVNGFEVVNKTNSFTFSSNLKYLSFFEQTTVNPFYGKTKELGYYDTALTDLELETLTSYRNWVSMVNELNLNIIYNG
jgi:hypothetical protein